MSKIDNYIILSIAEKTYEQFKKTNYMTYSSFCKKMSFSVNSNTLSQTEKIFICDIIDEIELIYGLKPLNIWDYINYYFNLDVEGFGDYYKYLKTMENNYPLLFIDK